MHIQETLTKENFWDEMMSKYPMAMKVFCNWIDEYKEAVNWNRIFGANEDTMQLHSSKYKFHEIPYAMQQGIWIAFVNDTLHKFFEQPEYQYRFDLEEDVKEVFGELEPILKEYPEYSK